MGAKQISCKISLFQSNDPRVSVGRFTYGNPQLMLWVDDERIEIGSFCSIAQNVTIFAGGEHNLNWVTTYPLRIAFGHSLAEQDGHPKTKGRTTIGNDVWIGYGATVLSGVTIGDGAVIGAGTEPVAQIHFYCGERSKAICVVLGSKKILNVFQRIRLRFFSILRPCICERLLCLATKDYSDRLLAPGACTTTCI